MYKVMMEKECGCFKRSDMQPEQTFESKDAALIEAQAMCSDMNEMFCQKHNFSVVEEGDSFMIRLAMN